MRPDSLSETNQAKTSDYPPNHDLADAEDQRQDQI
jgi:hypothetical protein